MKKILTLLGICFAQLSLAQAPAYIPASNLVGWWPFNGNANDESGNMHHGVNVGATLIIDRYGVAGKAYHYENAYTTLPSLPFNTAAEWTVSFWMKLNVAQSYDVIMEINQGSLCNSSPQVWQNNGNVYLAYCGSATGAILMGSTSSLQGSWNHFVLSNTTAGVKVYRNGTLLLTTVATWPTSSLINITLANDANTGSMHNRPSHTDMDDVAVWNRALTACEVSQIYSSSFLSFTQHPASQTVNPGVTVQFSATSTMPGATYQWQSDIGFGYQTLSNAGQYSGVTTSTLTVANISMSNNNQKFRCVINNTAACQATSDIATLKVEEKPSAVSGVAGKHGFSLYPNPATNSLKLTVPASLVGKSYIVTDMTGREVISGKVTSVTTQIAIDNISSGVYFFRIENSGGAVQKFIKS